MKKFSFVLEAYPNSYDGYPFVTLIQRRHDAVLCVIDNFDSKTIKAYVLDQCGVENIDERTVIALANEWHETSNTIPFSVFLSKNDYSVVTSKIYKTFAVDSITRVIGPLFTFPMNGPTKIKRRKRREISVKNVPV